MSTRNHLAIMTSNKAETLSAITPSSQLSNLSETLHWTPQEQALLEQPLAEKLQTAGANGTTELLADHLDVVSAQLVAEGKITQAQSDAILRLSNQGHRMAQMEQLVEQAIANQQGASIMFEGHNYDALDLAMQLGYMEGPGSFGDAGADILAGDPSGDPQNVEPEMAKFIALYQDAVSSAGASDPAVAATIRSAATQIATIAESLEDNVYYPKSGMNWNNALASTASQMNSAHICTAGSFKDSGVLCRP